jgi:serine/threonine protein phosphatase PrpC
MLETREMRTEDVRKTITASVQTDPGRVRDANEDSGRHISPSDAEIRLSKGTLTIVADGMGGHASGEVASRMAVDLIGELYYADNGLDAPEALRNAIELANARVFEISTTAEEYFGMGTTLVALVMLEDSAIIAHVGDSRIYRMRGGVLEALTTDHSQVMEMVKHGIITMEQARNHDDKNVILRAVGTQEAVEVEVNGPFPVEIGDTFLLCSDGLTDMVEDADIAAIMRAETNIHAACERLIEAANENGGHDNITAGIIDVAVQDTGGRVRITREIAASI